jgi:hypothetical protein
MEREDHVLATRLCAAMR